MGGVVAETTNQVMSDALFAVASGKISQMWLGLCYSSDEDWTWELSRANTDRYSSWTMGEPLIKGKETNCASGQVGAASIDWTSTPVDEERPFVCQIREGRVCPGGWIMHQVSIIRLYV